MTNRIQNLGRVLTILAKAEATEHDYHADVDAFDAPGECHSLVAKGAEKRARRARRHAEAVAGRPFRIIAREAKKRGCPIGSPTWDRLVGACITHPYLTGRM